MKHRQMEGSRAKSSRCRVTYVKTLSGVLVKIRIYPWNSAKWSVSLPKDLTWSIDIKFGDSRFYGNTITFTLLKRESNLNIVGFNELSGEIVIAMSDLQDSVTAANFIGTGGRLK